MWKSILKLSVVMLFAFAVGIKTTDMIANWYQWNIDHAYDKGRDMERLCKSDPEPPNLCDNHDAQTGHAIFTTRDASHTR
jgi:hypothetical protein